ncbi:hypothetical protein C0992_004820 [Termitomyces sp. T32_za158]|nr:hypothetical protein C0992_004820 [Termitomyces sp. T32_za158]
MEQAATLHMPTRGHFSALKWDETKPRELAQYFRELEYLLRDCNITDHTQMKEYASRYVSYDTTETWTGITEFNVQIPGGQEGAAPQAATYEEWKAAVIRLYPGAEELTRVAQWLLQNRKLYRKKERHLFQQSILTSLWTKIARQLEIARLDYHPLEPYDIKDVLEAEKWALKGILPLPTALIAALLTPPTPTNYVKQEDLDKAISTTLSLAMTRFKSLMNNSITANQQRNNQGSNNNGNNPPNNNLCHFCEELGHALKNQTFNGVEICQPKQALKGYRPMASATTPAAAAPAATAPATAPAPATTSTTPAAPAPDTAMPAAPTNQPAPAQPPLHLYSGIPNCYAPPMQKNFAAPNKHQEGPYQPTVPVYNIEKSNQVFSRIMKSAVMLSVEELCSIAPDVCNQMKTAVTPKCTMQATVQDADDINDMLPGFALSALPPDTDHPVAKTTVVDPVETYFKLLAPEDNRTILTVAQDSQAIRSIMLMVDNKSEVEAIVDLGLQIISISANVANELGIIYNPAIHLNMQSANGTINRSLGLAKNVECKIGDLTFYLQIHILQSPAYDILLGRPFNVLARSVVKTLSDDKTTLAIMDPNTGILCTVLTFPRGRHKQRHAKGPIFTNIHHGSVHTPSRK